MLFFSLERYLGKLTTCGCVIYYSPLEQLKQVKMKYFSCFFFSLIFLLNPRTCKGVGWWIPNHPRPRVLGFSNIISTCRFQSLFFSLNHIFGNVWRESAAMVMTYDIISTMKSRHFVMKMRVFTFFRSKNIHNATKMFNYIIFYNSSKNYFQCLHFFERFVFL